MDWADIEVEAKPGKVPESYNMPQHPRVGDRKVVVVSNLAADLGEAEKRYWFNILTNVWWTSSSSRVTLVSSSSPSTHWRRPSMPWRKAVWANKARNVTPISCQYPRCNWKETKMPQPSEVSSNPQPIPSIAVGQTFGAALQHHFKARVGQPSVQQHATAPQGRR